MISNSILKIITALLLLLFVSTSNAQNYIAPPMVNIPSGSFMMGSESGDDSTKPIHKVEIAAFQMAKYPITVAEFRKFALETGYNPESTCNDFIDKDWLRGPEYKGSGRWDKHRFTVSDYQPVTCVSFKDAQAYAKWLSKKTGIHYRLPTEQEWEYAAKANTTSRYFWGNDSNLTQAHLYGNFADEAGEYFTTKEYGASYVGYLNHTNGNDGEPYIAIVGLYRPNPFGLYDIVGNVSQFIASCYYREGYKKRSKEEMDSNKCEFIVHRGGNWHYPPKPHSVRDRYKKEGWNVGASMGFRLVANGQHKKVETSTIKFEEALKAAQKKHLETRSKIPVAPESIQLIKIKNDKYQLSWQPNKNEEVTGYEIYQSKSPYSHLYGGFYQNHYDKILTVDSKNSKTEVIVPDTGVSFRVVTKTDKFTSLPSKAIAVIKAKNVTIPGKVYMQEATSLENVALNFSTVKDNPEPYYLFKTNKSSDQELVTATFNINVEKSAWYILNYRGGTYKTGTFFKLWQDNTLISEVNFDPEINDKESKRHKVFLEKGKQTLQMTVSREGFDRWSFTWLKFTEMKK